MITVTKDDPYIVLGKSDCPPLSTAWLCGNCTGVAVRVEEDTENQGAVKIGPVPDDLPNGVYRLSIRLKNGFSECFTMKVNVIMCEHPGFPVVHHPTFPDTGGTIMECCPDASTDGGEAGDG